MKLIKKMTPIYILVLMLITPSLPLAGGWSDPSYIISLGLNSGNVIVYGDGDPGNPDFCDQALPLVLPPDRPGYSELYALLAASFLQGKLVDFYVNGCFGGTTGTKYPRITAMKSIY